MRRRCEGLADHGDGPVDRCQFRAKAEYGDKWYCGIHYKVAVSGRKPKPLPFARARGRFPSVGNW